MRISGITIPDNKQLAYGLTTVYGVGMSRATEILSELNIELTTKPTELTTDQENAIREKIDAYTTEGDLKREVASNIKRLKDIRAYRGVRHSFGLPVHGQRTQTNARTRKGPKKTMGSGRRKLEKT